MIRKIVLALLVLFILSWVGIAHLAKSNLIAHINDLQTENLKISFKEATVAGFPFKWEVELAEPKVTIIDQHASHELAFQLIKVGFNYNFTILKLDLGNKASYTSENFNPNYFNLASPENLSITISLVDNLFKITPHATINEVLKEISFVNSRIAVTNDTGDELLVITTPHINVQNGNEEQLKRTDFKIGGEFKLNKHYGDSHLEKGDIAIVGKYLINDSQASIQNLGFERKIELTDGSIRVNEAKCSVSGFASLSRNTEPQGKFSFEITRYEDLVDLLIPEDFIFSRPYIKKLIARAAALKFSNNLDEKIAFDFHFNDKDITFGRINIKDFKSN